MNPDCTRLVDLLLDSWDAPLSPADQAEFEAHLEVCPACVGRMKDQVVMRSVLQGFAAAEEAAAPPLPEPLVSRIVAAMRSASSEGGAAKRTRQA